MRNTDLQRQPTGHGVIAFLLAVTLTVAPLLTCCFSAADGAALSQHSGHDMATHAAHAADAGAMQPGSAAPHSDDCRCPPCAAANMTPPAPPTGIEKTSDWDPDFAPADTVGAAGSQVLRRPPATGPPPAAIVLAAVTPTSLHDQQLD